MESNHYQAQVAAIAEGVAAQDKGNPARLRDALDRFCIAADVPAEIQASMKSALDEGAPLIKTLWCETGGCSASIFAFLPGCHHCLTQAKSAYGLGSESDHFVDALKLMDNTSIPTAPERITVEMLPEFARLQDEARRIAA